MQSIKVTIWNEFRQEINDKIAQEIYPDGLHSPIQKYLEKEGYSVRIGKLDDIDQGLTKDILDDTDVLIWWGHVAHNEVKDEIVDQIQAHVLAGLGLIVLHSAHESKIFKRLMGTSCGLIWRDVHEREKLWNVNPNHPITLGIKEKITLEHEEMYGEVFDIPPPEDILFISWFEGGEIFRSGCTWHRGLGKIFYFRPGHEYYPTYYNKEILKIIGNAVRWAISNGSKYPREISKDQIT